MYVEEKISHVKNLPNKMENNQSDYGTKDMHYINIQDRRVWHLASVGRETWGLNFVYFDKVLASNV